MWSFEASALAFIQFSVPASFCARIDCRGRVVLAATDDSERVLRNRTGSAVYWIVCAFG